MMVYARGLAIAEGLEALGIRAYLDPALASPPCILVIPPNLNFDLQCDAVTAEWQLVALAPAVNSADHNTWKVLESLILNTQKVLELQSADLVSYVVNGRTYPAYLLICSEGVD